MPKKRFTSQYSKPQSTVHPSLNSPATASSSSSNNNDASPTVNELISSLRKSSITSTSAPSARVAPTLPPQICNLLSYPQTPTPSPRARDRRRFDANGRRVPPGPAPPRSWLEGSRFAPREMKRRVFEYERLYPSDVGHLPGFPAGEGKSRKLQDMCLRTMAKQWEYVREYERNNLADLPTRLRMLLLSNISVYGPEDGVGFEGLRSLLMLPLQNELERNEMHKTGDNNEGFFRLDLSGSAGRSVSFKQLTELVQRPTTDTEADEADVSWEEGISRSLSPPIPHLTHLSLSHPPPTVSWKSLLQFSNHIPALTHLSLAFWPVPSLTPNSKTAVVSSRYGKDVQYGGTNYYSHSLDNDFREAAEILRRLANRLYGLEYLDLTGCQHWIKAVTWSEHGEGIDWKTQWLKLGVLRLQNGEELHGDSEYGDVLQFVGGVSLAAGTERELADARRGRKWIEVQRDDLRVYDEFWRGSSDDDRRRRMALDVLPKGHPTTRSSVSVDTVAAGTTSDLEVERRSVWEQ